MGEWGALDTKKHMAILDICLVTFSDHNGKYVTHNSRENIEPKAKNALTKLWALLHGKFQGSDHTTGTVIYCHDGRRISILERKRFRTVQCLNEVVPVELKSDCTK